MTRGSAIVLLLWLAALHAAVAQPGGGVLKGCVVDQQGKPVPGATVRIQGTRRGAITKPDGSFIVAGIRADGYDMKNEYDVRASAIGFLPTTKTKVGISMGQITGVDFILTPMPPDTGVPIVVHGRGVALQKGGNDGDMSRGGFVVRGSRGASMVILKADGVQLRPSANGTVEQDGTSLPLADARRVTIAPSRRYRPATEGTRIFSLGDTYPLPYGARNFAFDDPFTGGLGFISHYHTYYVSEVVGDAGIDRYGVSRRDVVEPSMKTRAEWIRGYEERRDMISPYERALASWTRRR